MADQGITRRDLLQAAAVGGIASSRLGPALGVTMNALGASERLVVGCIGVGGQGTYLLNAAKDTKCATIAAVCDVDREHAEKAAKAAGEGTAVFDDYRKLLDRKDIDAVIIAVPDHWHALVATAALAAGKHVYCEKPLAYSVAEGRAIVDAVHKSRRIFQTGTHHRTDVEVHEACELIRSGRIGKVERIDLWMWENKFEPLSPPSDPPANLNWDMWLGPAPLRPYHPKRCHFNFRWFREYAYGYMTDWGVHMVNLVLWCIDGDRAEPVQVEGRETPYAKPNLYDVPATQNVRWQFRNPEFEMTWAEPGPKEEKERHGMRFHGSKGVLTIAFGKLQGWNKQYQIVRDGKAVTDEAKVGTQRGDVKVPYVASNMGNWLAAIREGAKLLNPVEVGHHDAMICQLGDIASRLGRTLKWDAAKEGFIGDDEANAFVSRKYRLPWKLG
jgi:predicted dehydrogenase